MIRSKTPASSLTLLRAFSDPVDKDGALPRQPVERIADEQIRVTGMHGYDGVCLTIAVCPVFGRVCRSYAGGISLMALLDNFGFSTYDVFDRLRFNLDDLPHSSTGRIAVVGMPGAGKKTLCNSLWGWDGVRPSAETTRSYGLITLIDLPSDPYDAAGILYRLENTDLIVFVLDGEHGLDPDSFNWIARLRGLNGAMVVVLNKADRVPAEKLQPALAYLESRVARPIIPLQATSVQNVRDHLLAMILKVCPDLAVPLATEVTALRPMVAMHLITQAAMTSLSLSLEVNTHLDPGVLVGLQMRLIRQIAAIYGYREKEGLRQRIGLSLALRWIVQAALKQVARLQILDQKAGDRVGAGVINVVSTFLVGRTAMAIYGAQLPPWLMHYTPQSWRANHVHTTSSRPV